MAKTRARAARTTAAEAIGYRHYNQGILKGPRGDYNRMRVLPPRAEPAEREDPGPTSFTGRAKELLSGRAAERREKNRTRAPRNMMGRRG